MASLLLASIYKLFLMLLFVQYFVWLCVEFVFCSCLKWCLTIQRIVTKTQLNCCTVSWKMPASILAFVADRLSCSYMMTLLIHALLMSVLFWKMVIDSQLLLLLLQCELSKVSELMNFFWFRYYINYIIRLVS